MKQNNEYNFRISLVVIFFALVVEKVFKNDFFDDENNESGKKGDKR